MFKLREARYEDFSEISRINNTNENVHLSVKQDQIDKAFFTKIIEEDHRRIYLVEKTGRIIAFLLFRIDSISSIIYIDELSIDASYEKKGLDEHLYQKVERIAEKKGIKQLMARITTENADVHNFFARKGWVQDSNKYLLNMKEIDKE
ncbi:GNAT family N-acetyltransferase [Virgibacillus ndiopensis]|uniref:GNAT family N-acetyltransferase n=1 Tax=Virgibacillus ndiopensis TaxID=2004408 RepID=UPI000C077BE8|nr:GNAT family N-acetyltransferase [Virgibacillus ndiopensis]